jgi:hypothetical protein
MNNELAWLSLAMSSCRSDPRTTLLARGTDRSLVAGREPTSSATDRDQARACRKRYDGRTSRSKIGGGRRCDWDWMRTASLYGWFAVGAALHNYHVPNVSSFWSTKNMASSIMSLCGTCSNILGCIGVLFCENSAR